MIISAKNLQETRKLIDKAAKNKEEIIVLAQNSEFNRKILENKKVNILLNPGFNGEDRLKQRDSGLNEVLCKIAKENKIKIGINIEDLTKNKEKEQALILSRIIQNIRLCKRTGTEIRFLGKYDKKNLFSLLIILGAPTSQAKNIVF